MCSVHTGDECSRLLLLKFSLWKHEMNIDSGIARNIKNRSDSTPCFILVLLTSYEKEIFQFYCLVLIHRPSCWKKGMIKTFVVWKALFRSSATLWERPSRNATLVRIRDIWTMVVLPLPNFHLSEIQSSLSPSTPRHPMWVRSSPHSQNESNPFWPIACCLQDYVCCVSNPE